MLDDSLYSHSLPERKQITTTVGLLLHKNESESSETPCSNTLLFVYA